MLHQAPRGGTTPEEGADVTLKSGATVVGTTKSLANGHYEFPDVAPGTYTVSATTTDGLSAQRTVTVLPGQGLVVDLLVQDVTRQVVVTVTSDNHTDLSGALVSLAQAGTAGPAAQQVIRTAPGADTYQTTFNQVPTAGTWDITRHRTVRASRLDDAVQRQHRRRHDHLRRRDRGHGDAGRAARDELGGRRRPRRWSPRSSQGTTTLASNVNVFVGGGDTVLFVPAKARR